MNGRRAFLASGAALLAAGCGARAPALPPGELLSTHHRLGHRLRDGDLPAPSEKRKVRVAIAGAGIAGLAAAWRLKRAGFDDFEIFELEDRAGGNARWGQNHVSAFPWGAHYVPLPTRESRSTRLLLRDLEVLLDGAEDEAPRYDERALVHAPQERLYRHGTWSETLAPLEGAAPGEAGEWHRFQALMGRYRELRGRDGRRAFAVPVDYSSRDDALLALDRITMAAWLRSEGFASPAVHWVCNYACRDDYGCDYSQASAWAGIHYFACRTGAGLHAEAESVLTWPEGNGRVVRGLMGRFGLKVTPRALVHAVSEEQREVAFRAYLSAEGRSVEIRAEHLVWAAPFAFAARALPGHPLAPSLANVEYAPWVTANLTLREPPYVHHGAPLSWDNVIHDSASVGYVVATHQGFASRPGPTVITWYLPLAQASPGEARRQLLAAPRERWAGAAIADLAKPHPEIAEIAERIDVFANGHAMAIPRPGAVWGGARARVNAHRGRLHFAHADASGVSLFEEACDRGVAAAEAVLRAFGARVDTFRA